ncbi:beta-glucosidase [Bifidobacterium lemurum]|uniref:Beta-glucosidase n=1 Tax=Bifidobacterium lemurum TaxID=1603886 RepID=A0A261FRG4_9BIFI|nr:glycoside hydrolase family 3 N-terminal domain-containing protein [Bifidobacterium lemurum]OZG61747.1 beta-glucosidase [Bifidobacterium lemurum]QOL34904.1 glycoside hydrolase family 3 C-terminal domain-containing protein [Bifidobacterium lemurum]
MAKRENRWVKPLVIAAIVVVVAAVCYLAYTKIYDMLFGGAVAVSMEDVYSTLNAIKWPIIIALVVIVAAVALGIGVRKQSTEIVKLVRWQAVVASVAAVVVAFSVITLNIEYSLINKVMTGSDGLSAATQEESLRLGEEITGEGIVLLKNEGDAMPLSTDTKLNVFGWASTNPTYGGTGSGSVDESTAVTLLEGLHNAGFETNETLTRFYEDYRSDRPVVGMQSVDWTVPQPTIEQYDDEGIFEDAQAYSDTALIVIGRSGGEGMDLPDKYSSESSYNKSQNGGDVVYSTQEDDIDSDKSYLELTNREIQMVERVTESFDSVYVVVNSANAMELGWLDEYDSIKGAVWCGGASATGFNALGEVLSGEINPSGRLADTYVYDLRATPTYNNYGNFEYENSTEITQSDENVAKFVNYVENIYVGYKYYETAAVEGVIDYDAVVQYPFGYGLSYTTFEEEISGFERNGSTTTVEITVTNTGDTAGKDVVELYYTPPYYNGGIEKASTNLLDFAKTDALEPGESQTLEIVFDDEDMASYDDQINKSYVLEHGEYTITLNTDSHTVVDSRSFTIDDDAIYNDDNDGKRSTDLVTATNQFDDARGDVVYLSRADHFANYDEATAAPTDMTMSEESMAVYQSKATFDAADYDDADAEMPVTGADNGLTIQDMTGLDYDDELWDDLLDQLTVDEMVAGVADGGFHMVSIESINSGESVDADGPAGLSSNFNDSMTGTAFPPAVVIASTWNKDLAEQRGTQVVVEGKELGITGWYGPAMNIHRSAFSGRNFEYYSEDGTLSGFIGAAEVTGATEQGMMTYIKHFALNDQETNRTNGLCTWATEQSIREIYLKAFEKSFKEGKSLAVMSSFNAIGARWAGSNSSLLQSVLRDEWGFHGAVDTDAMDPLADFYMDLNRGIRTGLTHGLSMGTYDGLIDDTESAGTVIALREAMHENLYAVANSTAVEKSAAMPMWAKCVIAADIIIALLLVGSEVLAVRAFMRRRNENAVTVVNSAD